MEIKIDMARIKALRADRDKQIDALMQKYLTEWRDAVQAWREEVDGIWLSEPDAKFRIDRAYGKREAEKERINAAYRHDMNKVKAYFEEAINDVVQLGMPNERLSGS